MALHLNKLPEFQAPDPLNFQPLAQGIDSINQAQQLRDQRDQQQQQFEATNALAKRRAGLAERQAGQQDEEAFTKKLGSAAGVIDGMPDGPQRQAAWNALIGRLPDADKHLATYGINHEDHINGPKFLMAEAFGPKDPQKEAQANAQTRYTNTLADEAQRRGTVLQQDADTRKFAAISSAFPLGQPITPEAIQQQSQPGGVIHAAFGGGVPLEKAQGIIRMAQLKQEQDLRSQTEPTPLERELGITREHKVQALKDQGNANLYGMDVKDLAKKGQRILPDGSIQLRPGAGTAGERNAEVIAASGLKNLDAGYDILKKSGGAAQFFGADGGPEYGGMKGGYGEAGRGFRSVRAAILDLNFALSGKSVSNKEREEFLSLYMPKWNDSTKTQAWKEQMVRNYFGTVLDMRKHGTTDEALKAAHDQSLQQGLKGPPDEPTRPSNGGSQRTGASKAGPQPGLVQDGYRFMGGDPANKNNWQQVR